MGVHGFFPWLRRYKYRCKVQRIVTDDRLQSYSTQTQDEERIYNLSHDAIEEIYPTHNRLPNGKYETYPIRSLNTNLRLYYNRYYVLSFNLDMNSLFHSVAQKTLLYGAYEGTDPERYKQLQSVSQEEREQILFMAITDELLTLVRAVDPHHTLLLSVDGPAPVAKLYQQKQRRYKAAINTGKDSSKSGNVLFDPNVITPGTKFMEDLSQYIIQWLNDPKIRGQLPNNVIYSSHLVPGEGEHKITQYLNSINFYREIPKDETRESIHVIYGNDADLIMIGLLTQVNYRILRYDVSLKNDMKQSENSRKTYNQIRGEQPHRKQHSQQLQQSEQNTEKTDGGRLVEKYVTVNVPMIRNRIVNQINISIEDFVLLTFFMGDDFIPIHPSLSVWEDGLDTLIEIIRNGKLKLIIDDKLNWPDILKLIRELSTNERLYLNNRLNNAMNRFAKVKALNKSDRGQTLKQSIDRFHSSKGQNVVDLKLLRNKYYSNIFNGSKWDIQSMVIGYFSTLLWNLNYYKSGIDGINVFWFYRFNYSPFFTDMHNVLSEMNESELRSVEWEPTKVKNRIFTPFEQLVAVLPQNNIDLIPKELQHLLLNMEPTGDLAPSNIVLDSDWNVERLCICCSSSIDRSTEDKRCCQKYYNRRSSCKTEK